MTSVAWSSDVPQRPTDPPLPWARWRLDDWQDSSGNNRHLTPVVDVNGYPSLVVGPRGSARQFSLASGVSPPRNYATRDVPGADFAALASNAFSIAVWWRPAALTAGANVATLAMVTSSPVYQLGRLGLSITRSLADRFNLICPCTATGDFLSFGVLPLGVWTHVACVVTPVQQGNDPLGNTSQWCRAQWYRDGVLVRDFTRTTSTANTGSTSFGVALPLASQLTSTTLGRVGVGAMPLATTGTVSNGCDGAIDDAQVFGRALGAGEVARLYAQGNPQPLPALVSFGA